MSTRTSDKRLSVLPETPGQEHYEISGCKLPTYKQVLLCYLAHFERLKDSVQKSASPKRLAAKAVQEKVLYHYRNAGIDHLSDMRMYEVIEALYHEYTNIRKLPAKRQNAHEPIYSKFHEKLDKTMPFWPRDILSKMESRKAGHVSEVEKAAIDEDIKFLQSMMDDRKATYAARDRVTPMFERRREEREKRVRAGPSSEDPYLYYQDDVGMDDSDESSDDGHTAALAATVAPKRKHRRTQKVGDWTFIPHDILKRPRIVAFAARNKLSSTVVAAFVKELMSECGSDPSKVTLSHTSAFRYARLCI